MSEQEWIWMVFSVSDTVSSIDLTVPHHSIPARPVCYKISNREISRLIIKKRKAADVPSLHLSKFQGSIKA